VDVLQHLALPAIAVGDHAWRSSAGQRPRHVLSSTSENGMRQGVAPEVGLPQARAGNALMPTVTLLALEMGIFGGAVITETVFAWPGWDSSSQTHSTRTTMARRCSNSGCAHSLLQPGGGRRVLARRSTGEL